MKRPPRFLLLLLSQLFLVLTAGSSAEEDPSQEDVDKNRQNNYGSVIGTVDDQNRFGGRDEEVFSSTFEMARLLRKEIQFSRDLHEYQKELKVRNGQD